MSQVDPSQPQTSKTPRWMKIVLGLSLALNLAIVGLAIGAVLRFGGPDRPRLPSSYAVPYVRALPDEVRKDIFATIRTAQSDEAVPDRRMMRRYYAEMLEVLRAETLDRDAVWAVLERQTQGMLSVQKIGREAWLGHVAAMTTQERQAYADRIEEHINRRRGKRKNN